MDILEACSNRLLRKAQMICPTRKTNNQNSIAIHAKVTTAMAPIVIQRTIVPTARSNAAADETGGV
jgi:hypothetical protein